MRLCAHVHVHVHARITRARAHHMCMWRTQDFLDRFRVLAPLVSNPNSRTHCATIIASVQPPIALTDYQESQWHAREYAHKHAHAQ